MTHLKCTTQLTLQSPYLHAPYITHAVCLSGEGSFTMHNKTFSVKTNDLFIFIKGNLVTNLQFSADCQLLVLFVAKEYLRLHCANNYGAKLSIDAFQYPVLSLTETEKNQGNYRTHRAVSYYAQQLSVTPQQLSAICTKYSGETAQYWIDTYTMSEILYLIRSQHYSLSQIADQLNFSSLSYFSRYVQRHTGFSPSEL